MCGRYALNESPARLKEHFGTTNELDLQPRFNIAPTQTVPVVRLDEAGNRVFTLARWGLIPSWVKDSNELQHPISLTSAVVILVLLGAILVLGGQKNRSAIWRAFSSTFWNDLDQVLKYFRIRKR